MKKSIYIIIIYIIILLCSCDKKQDSLFSISISPHNMIGTPAEQFSLQQIKMFQASNKFVFDFLNNYYYDSLLYNNMNIAPFYLINNLMIDSNLTTWQQAYANHYNLTLLNNNQMTNMVNSFINTVKNIDSTINIISNIIFEDDSCINIKQQFNISLTYSNSMPNDIDNIFTTIDNKKPRIDFITISDNIRTLLTNDEQVTELPIGDGNYMLMLIKPVNTNIKDYIKNFSEDKYFEFINTMQDRKINVSFPLVNLSDSLFDFSMPQYSLSDTIINFPKKINLFTQFSIKQADATDITPQTNSDMTTNILQINNSQPIKYSSPFIFIIRDNNSNLIMYIGIFCRPV